MAWTSSTHSTSSLELEEEFSLTAYLDTIQSGRAKLKNTQEMRSSPDSETDTCQTSQSGTMSAHSTGDLGGDQLTFFAEDSPAKTSVQRVKEQELPEHARDYGRNMRDSLERCGLSLSLPKTHHCFALGDLELSSKTWPRWGIMLDGELSELGLSVRRTSATECGSWLTPTMQDSNKATKRWREDRQNNLTAQVFTPVTWPTPATRDYKGGHAPQSLTRKDGKSRMDILPNVVVYGGKSTQQLSELDQSSCKKTLHLNPSWVEWLMGWPIGWTDLKRLETDKFHNVQQWHGKFSPLDSTWKVVSFAADCKQLPEWEETDELGDLCSICGLHYCEECECPGPTEDGMSYREFNGILYGKSNK